VVRGGTAERPFDAVRNIAAAQALLASAAIRRLIGTFAILRAWPDTRRPAVLAALTPTE
jgi:hypothetical protein